MILKISEILGSALGRRVLGYRQRCGYKLSAKAEGLKQILMVSSFGGVTIAGAEVVIDLIFKAFQEKSLPVRLLTTRKGTEYEALGGGTHLLPVRAFVAGARSIDWLLAIRILVKVMSGSRPDLLHAQDTYSTPATVIAARFLGLPCVVTTHNRPDMPWEHLHPVIRRWARWHLDRRSRYLKRFMENAECVVFVSHSLENDWLEYGLRPRSKTVIHNPFPEWEIMPPRPDDGNFVILAPGRLEEHLGFKVAIEAIAMLDKKEPISLIVVGDGSCRDELEKLNKDLGLSGIVSFTGWMPHSAMKKYYAESDVVLVPIIANMPLPTVVLEAMSVGRPVIATRAGGLTETVLDGTTGILCEPSDPQGLAQAIDRLRSSRELRLRMGRAGARSVRERFSTEKAVRGCLETYGDILGVSIDETT